MREFWYGVFGSILGVLAGVAMVIVAAAFLLSAALASLIDSVSAPVRTDAGPIILEIDLRSRRVVETNPSRGFVTPSRPAAAPTILRALHAASNDPKVDAVIVYTGGSGEIAAGHAEEIAKALQRIAATGRRVVGYVEDAGQTGLPGYLAAAGATEVWASPLARLDVPPALGFAFSDRAGYQTARLSAIAAMRGTSSEAVTALFADGPVPVPAALEAGLIDRIGSDYEARARAIGDTDATQTGFEDYLASAPGPDARRMLALIEVQGAINGGEPWDASRDAFAAAVTGRIETAIRDEAVRAVILRISSHEADAAAADQIAQAIRRAQQAGKPVVVSVGEGLTGWAYYAVAPADQIVTPALAALGGLGTAQDRLPASLAPRTERADAPPRTAVEEYRYELLLEAVAETRSLPIARVEALARGRLWTGRQAVERGLADEIGGLNAAAERARALAGAPGDDSLVLTPYPPAPGPLERALGRAWSELTSR